MKEGEQFLSYTLEHQFPHPVAAPYRCARTATCNTDRAAFFLATVDSLLRYVGAVLLSDFYGKHPSPEQSQMLEQPLLHPTMEKWADLVLALSAQLADRDPFSPKLVSTICFKNGKPTAVAKEMKELAATCTELLAEPDQLINESSAGDLLVELEHKVESLLSNFQMLCRYPLVVFRSHASADETGFTGFMLRWMGYGVQPLPLGVEMAGAVPAGRPMLVTEDVTRGLDLSPFIDIVPADGDRPETLYMVNGLRTPEVLKLECFHGAKFKVNELKANGAAAGLSEFMQSWSGGGGTATLSPTENSSARLKFKSRLMPSEKVLDERYQAVGFVGRGGIGAVYRMYDLNDKRDRAVKILYPDLSRNEFFTRYFLETGSLLSGLTHENLVQVHEASYSSTLQENHILMDYLEGGSLAELLGRKEELPPRQAVSIAAQVLSALGSLHGAGLIHGDIHPGNILFDLSAKPHLSDFGILKLPSAKMATFRPLERIHSLRYAAPELVLSGRVNPQSDLYSLALVLYEMLTGDLPSKTEYTPPSEVIFPVPEDLDNVLERALAPAPEARFATASEFLDALQEILDGMGEEYVVSASAQAQQLIGHLNDVQSGHTEALDLERQQKMAADDFEAAARLLHLKADQIWDTDERVHWLLELAGLYFEKLDQPGRAVSIYRDCLELAPENSVAAQTLIAHFEKTEQWEELAELLEDLAEHATSPEREVETLEKLVEVYHVQLKDSAGAGAFLETLVEKTGAEERWVQLLVSLKEEAEDYQGAARALKKWLEMAANPEQANAVKRQLAQICHEKLDDTETATEYYAQVLETNPGDTQAMEALRGLYRQAFSYSSLAILLRQMIDSGHFSDEQIIELYQELGEIVSSYLYDTGEAVLVWGQLLNCDPENQTALSYLERLYLREGRNEEYLDVLGKKVELAESAEEKAGILLSAAMARLEFQSDVAGARKELEEALKLAPGHEGVEAALERLFEDHGDVDSQTKLLISRLDTEETRVGRMNILWKMAGLFEEGHGDKESAAQVMRQAFVENPRDPAVRKQLERLMLEAGSLDDLLAFYLEQAGDAPADLRDYLSSRVAHFCMSEIKEGEKAQFYLEKAREQGGDQELVLKGLIGLYKETEQWVPLTTALLDYAELIEGRGGEELFEEAALVVKHRLKSTDEAGELLDRLVGLVPTFTDQGVLGSLREACESLEDWDRLLPLLEEELKKEEDPQKAQQLRLQLGAAHVAKKDYPQAQIWLETALEKAPQDVAIQKALEEALAAPENWEGLVRLYKRLIPVTGDRDLRQEYMEKAAEIEVRVFDHLDSAIELYRQLISLAPDSIEYHYSLADALRRAGHFTELSWLYEQMVRMLKGDEKLTLLKEMGDVYYDELRNPEAALQALRQVMKVAPGDLDTFARVRSICEKEKRFEILLKMLAERSRHVPPGEKNDVLVDMAKVSAMEMGLLPPAKVYLDEVLKAEPDHDEAFNLYRQILERQENWSELASLLEQQFNGVSEEGKKVTLGLELAELYSKRLEHLVKATDVLELVLEIAPEDTTAALRLAQLYAQTSQWDRTASILVILQQLKDRLDEPLVAEFIFLSAQTYEALLKREEAIDAYREAIKLEHRLEESRKGLASLLYIQGAHEEARELVSAILGDDSLTIEETRSFKNLLADLDGKLGRKEQSREHLEALLTNAPGDMELLGKLLALCKEEKDKAGEARFLEQMLDVETDPEQRFALHVRLGDVCKELPDRQSDAVEVYREALQDNPESMPVLVSLGQLLMQLEQHEEAVEILRQAEDLETAADRKAALALTQGLLYSDYLENPDEAAGHFMRCLEHDPTKWDAFTALEEIAVNAGNWEQQRDLYQLVLERLPEGADLDLLYKLNLNLGRIMLEKFGDSAGAVKLLETASALKPEAGEAKELAAGIYLQTTDNVDRALVQYRTLLDKQPRDPNLLLQFRKALAKAKLYDQAWCVAGVQSFLGCASQKEKAFYQKFASSALKIKPRVIDIDMFRADLLSGDQEWELTEILQILYDRMGARLQLKSAKDLGLTKRELFDDKSAALLGKLQDIAAKILGISRPPTYVRPGSGGVSKEACYPPVLIFSGEAAAGKATRELRFELGRTMATFLSPHMVVGVLDRNTMRVLLGNALKLMVPSLPDPPGSAKENAELRKQMQKGIPGVELATFKELVGILRTKGEELNVKKWLGGVEKTVSRFGLLLANDFPAAASAIVSSPVRISPALRDDIVDDLIRFTISAANARLRKYVGVTVVKG